MGDLSETSLGDAGIGAIKFQSVFVGQRSPAKPKNLSENCLIWSIFKVLGQYAPIIVSL